MRGGLLAGLALGCLVGGSATAVGRRPVVAGDYTYELSGGISNVELVAFSGRRGATGSMHFARTYTELGGTVTCVTVRGADAWIAGVADWGDAFGLDGWMVRVVDPGTRDRAVTFVDEYALAVGWCESASTDLNADSLQPVTDGWLVVR